MGLNVDRLNPTKRDHPARDPVGTGCVWIITLIRPHRILCRSHRQNTDTNGAMR